jgi:hypothetical protein
MPTLARKLWIIILVLGITLGRGVEASASPPGGSHKLSGPYTFENLTIFLIHGEDHVKDKIYLTLHEALKQKKVIVHETSNVNELAIENISIKEEVFVLAGDIVKGGRQDRVIAYDLVVPARSGRIPIASFCVEAGRWTQRGSENAAVFESSSLQAPTKDLKIAVRKEMAQANVWRNVASAQMQLGANLGQSVRSTRSATSLQLSLEDKKLQEAVQAYLKKLAPIADGQKDVIGYAFAINGQVNSADVFASHALFEKLWPVLLKGSAIEAFAELKKGKKFPPVSPEAVKAFLADAARGKASEKDVTKRIRIIQKETRESLLFECRDREQSIPLRSSYIKK